MKTPSKPFKAPKRRKRNALGRRMVDTTGVGPFSGTQVKKPKTTVPKLSDPTRNVGKKMMNRRRRKK